MKPLLLIMAAFACCNVASAKLGETISQVETRYGKPTDTEKNSLGEERTYSYKVYTIIVTYVEGKDISERISGVDGKERITEGECIAFAKAVTGETDWKLKTTSPDRHWKHFEAAEYRAVWCGTLSTDSLTIGGKASDAYAHAKRKQDEANSNKEIQDAFGSAPKSK